MRAIGRREVSLTGATGKLNGQAGSIHIRAIFICAAISGLLASSNNVGRGAYGKLWSNASADVARGRRMADRYGSSPGTTSLASNASSYSMKPKPFMSLISVMFPVPSLK